jgi:hypothetical protein
MIIHTSLNHITDGRRHFVSFEVLHRVPYLPPPTGYTSRFISPNNPIISAGAMKLLLLTGLWVGRRRLWFLARDENLFPKFSDWLWCLPSFPFNGWSGLCVGSEWRPLMLTTLLHLVPVSRMSGALPLLLFTPSWNAQWYFLYLCRPIIPS